MADVKDELLNHSYDGIQEYDNPLPRWWVGMFYATIAWSIFYIPYYALEMGDSPESAYEKDMEKWNELHPVVELASAEEMAVIVADEARISKGKAIYDIRCIACHLADGGGLVGPNLTDEYWIHGGSPEKVAHTIYHGVPEKGMIAWKTQLNIEEIYAATAYIMSLQGTTPAKPKAPEGTKSDSR